jgi:hypothetical protein
MRNLRITAVALSVLAVFGVSSGVAQAATTLDQSSSTVNSASGVTTGNEYAQLVTAGLTGTLSSVEVSALRINGTTADLTASIRSVSGGQPSGADLATASVPYTSVLLASGWVTFDFSSPISVSAGDQFAIVITTTASGASPYSWAYETTSSYAGGVSARKLGAGSWTNEVFGFAFRTYVNTPDSGPTPPPVMQQFGMPSSGTCDAAAPVMLNWGGAGSGGWGNSWAQWANGGNGGAVCTRTLVYSNAVGHWIVG